MALTVLCPGYVNWYFNNGADCLCCYFHLESNRRRRALWCTQSIVLYNTTNLDPWRAQNRRYDAKRGDMRNKADSHKWWRYTSELSKLVASMIKNFYMPHRNNGEVSLESWHCTYPQQESHLPQFLLLSHARQGDIKSYDLFLYGNVIFIRVFFFFSCLFTPVSTCLHLEQSKVFESLIWFDFGLNNELPSVTYGCSPEMCWHLQNKTTLYPFRFQFWFFSTNLMFQ